MSHGKELGHEYSSAEDKPPRWIDREIDNIGMGLIAIFVVIAILCVACMWVGFFFWLMLAGLIAVIVMMLLTWWVRGSADGRAARHTATLSGRLEVEQRPLSMTDGDMRATATRWREQDGREQAAKADLEAERKRKDAEAKKKRDEESGTPTDFRARRSGAKDLLPESNKIQKREAEEAKRKAAAAQVSPQNPPANPS
ncbi:hypothetical protein GII36_05000 [Candidatus Mycosynbacter amalyticus]|uniref:Uncharacterized protein n=1 Tax=Candidatus Mycosynbacter amalyticus TaxID=2665156 RepID=A0A857MM50_9BACT|nr:hypothetical protein [Candidatus Mycosynbacter amalyticus]QHN43178.1 hypothetical protein GII36_05000 [Candidatus Mycosynbacter amalyticus]